MSSSVAEILAAARAGEAALVGEVCGYLVLGAADAVLETGSRPRPATIRIHDDGNVELSGEKTPEPVAERALRELLGALLLEVRTPFPNLSRVASRADARGIASLITELEAALVPVNRRAARRSLSRLSREARRAVERGLLVPEFSLPSDAGLESDASAPDIAPTLELSLPPRLNDWGLGGARLDLGPREHELNEPELAPDTQRVSAEVDPFDDEPTVVVAPVEESLTDLIADLVSSSAELREPAELEPFDISIDVDFDSDEAVLPLPSPTPPRPEPVTPEPVGPAASSTNPPSAGSDRYRTVRPRSDLPPKNPTPLIPPSEGGRARPSDLEGLLSSMKPRAQPDQLNRALDGLARESTRPGGG